MPTNESLKNMLDKEHEDKSIKEIMDLSPAALQGVSDRQADLLKEAFRISTIEQLANNRYFRMAQALQMVAECE